MGESKIDQEDELGESHTGWLGVDFWDGSKKGAMMAVRLMLMMDHD